jgi:hypothetical protein
MNSNIRLGWVQLNEGVDTGAVSGIADYPEVNADNGVCEE